MNLKKYIKPAGLFAGSLVVINVGIYFLLQATTPKIGPRAGEAELAADSLHSDSLQALASADSVLADSALETAHLADTTAVEENNAPPLAEPVVAEVMPPPASEEPAGAALEEEPDFESESLTDAPPPDAESAAQAVKEGDWKEIAKLAKYLESMKPADAAAIASQLESDQIIVLMMRMKDRTAGKILAELPVEQAARIAARMSQTASRARSGS